MQIQINWLLQKPTDLDLHCLQNRVYPGSAGQGFNIVKRGNKGQELGVRYYEEVHMMEFLVS